MMAMPLTDLTGHRFGRLTVLERGGYSGERVLWVCLCDCAGLIETSGDSLKAGTAKSCGCLKLEPSANRAHGCSGKAKTRTYEIWCGMHARCRPGNKASRYYSERGIKVCARWAKFENFLADMGEAPEGLTLDREKNAKGYTPSNCRWTTRAEQARNRSNKSLIRFRGKNQTVGKWCEDLGIPLARTLSRLWRGWPPSKAFTLPLRARNA